MYEMIIVGAGPAGISMAAEARAVGIPSEQIVVLEKGEAHSWALRKFYPAAKVVTANYKGIDAVCTGVMCSSAAILGASGCLQGELPVLLLICLECAGL